MELRNLETFLTIVHDGSISGAADELMLTQPTVSRQLAELEKQLGTQLLERTRNGVTMTRDGMLLARRAGEILDLVRTTETEIYASRGEVAGVVRIGAAETTAFDYIARTIRKLRDLYPDLRFHIVSTTADDAIERMENGRLDCALILGKTPRGFEDIPLPTNEVPGLLMRKKHPLASKRVISVDDLRGIPLLVSQRYANNKLPLLPGVDPSTLDIVGTHNLHYNSGRLVRAGVGCAITLQGLSNDPGLTFRPIDIKAEIPAQVVWKSRQSQSRACEAFLLQLAQMLVDAERTVGKQKNKRRMKR